MSSFRNWRKNDRGGKSDMEHEERILNVLFMDEGGDDIYVTVSFTPFFPTKHKCIFMGYLDYNYKLEIAPPEISYPLPVEVYSSLVNEHGIIKERCEKVFPRVVTKIKRKLINKMKEVISKSFPGYTIKFDYQQDPNGFFIPVATYEGDKVIVNYIRLRHYEFAHHAPMEVEAGIQLTSATKCPFEVKSYEEIKEKMSELIRFYREEIYPPTIQVVRESMTEAKSLLQNFLETLKNEWEIEEGKSPYLSPYLSYRCAFSDPTVPKMESIIYTRELSFNIPRHIGETLRENWEKSKGNWLKMIEVLRFMLAFGKDYEKGEVEELLTFLDDLENYIKNKER